MCTSSVLVPMQLLVDALAASVPSIGNVLVVCAFIWIIFGVVGVSMFSGRLHRCVDGTGSFEETLDPDLVPDRQTCLMLGYRWENALVHFDNLADASLALLQVVSPPPYSFSQLDSKDCLPSTLRKTCYSTNCPTQEK